MTVPSCHPILGAYESCFGCRLPAGCWMREVGRGEFASTLQSFVGRLVISDLSAPMLGQAQLKGVACTVQAHTERLPFPDEHFDRVLVVDALHHFADPRLSMAELIRVLKPGGRLLIEEPDIATWPIKLMALAETLALMGSHFYSPQQISYFAAANGLEAMIAHDDEVTAWVIVDKP